MELNLKTGGEVRLGTSRVDLVSCISLRIANEFTIIALCTETCEKLINRIL